MVLNCKYNSLLLDACQWRSYFTFSLKKIVQIYSNPRKSIYNDGFVDIELKKSIAM